ncbi:hypothetical protein ACFQLX_15045 [Streptomyces polyrhachis]|uniref:SnoaL-like domain-containing protein n=1 Tax=Streptomyces polyrhachis TaxID=1282885 RepID=A0ABW2GFJ4_9ACTN
MTAGQHIRRATTVLGRSTLVMAALATATVSATAMANATATAGPGAQGAARAAAATVPDAETQGSECADVREKVERLEGRITPNACAFIKRQIAFGETPTGTPPEPGESSHPRVRAYLDIFDPEATLWEAGGAPQRGHTTIGNSIIGSLRLVPDLRYRGTEVVADGAVAMFGQWNEVTIKGQQVAYPQIARNVLSDDGKSIQARRYYDRYTVFRSAAPELRNLFEGITDAGSATGGAPERFRADEITARLAAWNNEDTAALTERMGGARLTAPGLPRPLATAAGKTAYLQRLFDHADVQLTAGQVAFGETTTYVEWHGTATSAKGTDVPFGIVERFGPGGEWELSFDTLPLIADKTEIAALFQRLAQP